MKFRQPLVAPLLVVASLSLSLAHAADGLIAVKSPHSAKVTMDKFETVAKAKGLNVFARIAHAAGATKVGKSLRSTEALIFGNPHGGTPFMECAQTVGIDLPLKALVWEDAAAQVYQPLGGSYLRNGGAANSIRRTALARAYTLTALRKPDRMSLRSWGK